MQIFQDFESVPPAFHNGAISIGKFDGVHRGHTLIFQHLKNYADKLSAPSIVVTFCPHPSAILHSNSPHSLPIQTLARKIDIIENFNVDAIIVIKPDKQFLLQSAETFFFNTLNKQLHARIIVCGKNFTFGRDRTGTPESIKNYCKNSEIEIKIVEPVQINGITISSSLVRKLIKDGHINEANNFLGMPYHLNGIIVKGNARGRLLGFPTANIENIETIIPKYGVYSTIATLNKQKFIATTNIGISPTFNQTNPRIETFIHDFNNNIYGKELHLDVLELIREIKQFNSKDELITQMKNDIIQSEIIAKKFLITF
ncbi:MAG: bifunctional riboflavin kinase/FAD synthetase [Planctomycetaceae bacterium]|jgi:riboflavin kinase/FMN adenylyltransferase|nr:bifunctional riboflavin kinase/FAD synthetase [Planctomycetaceae bacterium]